MKLFALILLYFIASINLLAQTDCYQTFYQKGINAMEADSFEVAVNAFKAAKICPDLPAENDVDDKILEAQNGFIIAIKKARDEALAAKQEAEAINRSLDAITLISLGQEKELQKQYADAIVFYSKAIEIFPDSVSFYEKRAPLYLHDDIRNFNKAISDFNFLIKNGSPNKLAEYCGKIAYAYEQIGDLTQAKQFLVNAITYAAKVDEKIYVQKLNWFDLRQEARSNPDIGKTNDKTPASFSIVYRESDYPGASLQLKIKIGRKTYRMDDNNFIIRDLPAGEYRYQLSGELAGAYSPIGISGSGTMKIVPNTVYFCNWKTTIDANKGKYYDAWLSAY